MSNLDPRKEIEDFATEVFGNQDKAMRWLQKPMRQFKGRSLLEVIEEDHDTQPILDLLYRLDHGYWA